jgi:hypothetical protein
MSKQQLAAILEMSAQNPIPANATPAVMRAWVEDFAGRLPVAQNVQIERVKPWNRPSSSLSEPVSSNDIAVARVRSLDLFAMKVCLRCD